MIGFAKLASKIWRHLNVHDATPFTYNTNDIAVLDYRVQQWQDSIPPDLQLPSAATAPSSSRLQHRLQILLYLRANQARILIHRPILHSASSIQENLRLATRAVDTAKDSIRALTHLNRTTNIYQRQQVCFNYFLVSALAVLFLASCHAPVQFSPLCREEFSMALDLVKGFSERSLVSKRLWRAIKDLKDAGLKVGLSPTLELPSSHSHISASMPMPMPMVGLTRSHPSQQQTYSPATVTTSTPTPTPTNDHIPSSVTSPSGRTGWDHSHNGFQLSNEMMNLFEATTVPGFVAFHEQQQQQQIAAAQGAEAVYPIPVEQDIFRSVRALF